MVFCCYDSGSPEQHVNDVSAYPGNRRLVKTAGNALMEAPVETTPILRVNGEKEESRLCRTTE